jgi:hypothetical protein
LRDKRVGLAVGEIIDDGTKPRYEIQKMIKEKEKAVEDIALKYKNEKITDEEIRLCLRLFRNKPSDYS